MNQYHDYYPFGLRMASSWDRDTENANNRLYNAGNERNATTGWDETYFRMYDPAIGRFHGMDPLAVKYAGISPYNYTGSNPIMFNDPMGDYAMAYGDYLFNWVGDQGSSTGEGGGGGGGGIASTNGRYRGQHTIYGGAHYGGLSNLNKGPSFDDIVAMNTITVSGDGTSDVFTAIANGADLDLKWGYDYTATLVDFYDYGVGSDHATYAYTETTLKVGNRYYGGPVNQANGGNTDFFSGLPSDLLEAYKEYESSINIETPGTATILKPGRTKGKRDKTAIISLHPSIKNDKLLQQIVVGHELVHAIHHASGIYNQWINDYGSISAAHNISELLAWTWTLERMMIVGFHESLDGTGQVKNYSSLVPDNFRPPVILF